MRSLRLISLILVIVGALNWGLIGLFRWDLVQAIFGGTTTYAPGVLTSIIYILVALAGIYLLATLGEYTKAPEQK